MIIRKAKLKDLPEANKMCLTLLQGHTTYDPLFALKKDAEKIHLTYMKGHIYSANRTLVVAEEKGKLVGVAAGRIKKYPDVFKADRYGHIGDVYVKPRYRKQGLAGKLIKEVHAFFKSKGLTESELYVAAKNKEGLAAWKKYGYKDRMHLQSRKL